MALTKLFAVVLLPRWIRAFRQTPGAELERQVVEAAYERLFAVLGDEPNLPLADALAIYAQLAHEWDCVLGSVGTPTTPSTHWGDVYQNPQAYDFDHEELLDFILSLRDLQAEIDREIGVAPPDGAAPPGVFVWSYLLAMDKALAVCGIPRAIDWPSQEFPISKSDDIRWVSSAPSESLAEDLIPWLARLQQVQHAMIETDKDWLAPTR